MNESQSTPFVATLFGSDASEDSRRDRERQNLSLPHRPDLYPIASHLRGEMRQERLSHHSLPELRELT